MKTANCYKILLGGALLGTLALLDGCVVQPVTPSAQTRLFLAAPPTASACTSCGVITAIRALGASGYRVSLRMDNGSLRTLDLPRQPAYQVGDRVQILERKPYPTDY